MQILIKYRLLTKFLLVKKVLKTLMDKKAMKKWHHYVKCLQKRVGMLDVSLDNTKYMHFLIKQDQYLKNIIKSKIKLAIVLKKASQSATKNI